MVGVSFVKEKGLTETRAKILTRALEKIDREYEAELLRAKNKYLERFRRLASQSLPAETKDKYKKNFLKQCKKELEQIETRYFKMAKEAIDKEFPGADPVRLEAAFQKAPRGLKHLTKWGKKLWGSVKEWWKERAVKKEFRETEFDVGRTAESTYEEILHELSQLSWANLRKTTPQKLV
ncbi:MAG: hypothetical protein QXH27_02825 [Candidatus Micrarchaeia archaeon]